MRATRPLARALEAVCIGTDYGTLAHERVFEPLGLDGLDLREGSPGESWSPPLGASGLVGTPDQVARFAGAISSRDPRLLSRRGWDLLFDLDLWDSYPARRFDDRTRVALVQEGRVTGARSTLAVFSSARAAMVLMFAETDVFRDQAGEERLYQILDEGTLRWGDRSGGLRWGDLNPLRLFRPGAACRPCDWSRREGIYVNLNTGAQIIITEIGGAPAFISDEGEPLSIGPEIITPHTRLHDLYQPLTEFGEVTEMPWANGAMPTTIEFAERDDRVVGLLWGADWYEGPAAP
jgi:hypothetical protein